MGTVTTILMITFPDKLQILIDLRFLKVIYRNMSYILIYTLFEIKFKIKNLHIVVCHHNPVLTFV